MNAMLSTEAAARLDRDNPLSDDQVVSAVRGGALELFEVLMRRHNQLAFRTARSLLRDDDAAEEVVQQAWLSAWEHLGEFRASARFSTWLSRIVINEALMRTRRSGRELLTGDDAALEAQMPPVTPADTAEAKELARLLEGAIDALPELYRAVFVLREVEGLSTAEVAASLDVRDEVVKTRLHRARGLLRHALLEKVGRGATEVFTFGTWRCDRTVASVMRAIRSRS